MGVARDGLLMGVQAAAPHMWQHGKHWGADASKRTDWAEVSREMGEDAAKCLVRFCWPAVPQWMPKWCGTAALAGRGARPTSCYSSLMLTTLVAVLPCRRRRAWGAWLTASWLPSRTRA